MSDALDLIFTVMVVTVALFPTRVMRFAGLDPTRARDLFGFSAAALSVVTLGALVGDSFVSRHPLLFGIGLLLGIPEGFVFAPRLLRTVVGDTLYLTPGWATYVSAIVGLTIGTWALSAGLGSEVLSFTAGGCLTNILVLVGHVLQHERVRGPLYVRYGRPGPEA